MGDTNPFKPTAKSKNKQTTHRVILQQLAKKIGGFREICLQIITDDLSRLR